MHFIFVCKPEGNKTVVEWVEEQRKLGEVQQYSVVDSQGRTHSYAWLSDVPLTGAIDTSDVNYFEYQLQVPQKDGSLKVTYSGSWVTDLGVSKENVETCVKGARCRWKIENECFNTLKNQGYNINHSYGHGEENLSFNFFILNLIAFFFHQILEMTDELYQACRLKRGSKQNLWAMIRGFLQLLVFETWEALVAAILKPPQLGRFSEKAGFQPAPS